MPRSLFGASLVVVAVALAACSSAPAASQPGTSPTLPPSAAADVGGTAVASGVPGSTTPPVWLPEWADEGTIPDAVVTRRPLPFCGVERAPGPQPGEFIDRAVRLCFWEAHQAGTAAEFVSIQTTMEGAPIANVYRTTRGAVEVLTDFSQDPFGSGGWLRMTCGGLVEGEGESLLSVADCGGATPLE